MSTLDRFGVPYPMAAKSMMIQPKAKYKFRVLWYGPAGHSLGVNVDSIELPSITFDHHNTHKFNTEAGYLGKKRVSDFTVTIRDDIKSQVLSSVTTTILDNYNRFQRVLSGSSPDLYDYKFQMWVQFLSGKEITTGDAAAIAQNIDAGLTLADSLLGTDLGKNSEQFQGTLATMVIEGCCVTHESRNTRL